MGEFDRENEVSTKLLQVVGMIFCFILVIGLSVGFIFISHEKRQFLSETSEIEVDNLEVQVEIENDINTINSLNEEINKNKDVSLLINELKEEYTKLASGLENDIILSKTQTKIAYLLFEGGPYLLTNDILDVLNEYDTMASFCFSKKDEELSSTYERTINEGHTIISYIEDEDYLEESLNENDDFFNNTFKYSTNIVKFKDNSLEIEEDDLTILNDNSYGYVVYNSASANDNEDIGASQSIKNILETTNTRDILVVKLNDGKESDLEALPRVINGLKEQGYRLLPLFYDSIMVNKK